MTKYETFEEFFARNVYSYYAYKCGSCQGIIDYSKVDFTCPHCGTDTPPALPVQDREEFEEKK